MQTFHFRKRKIARRRRQVKDKSGLVLTKRRKFFLVSLIVGLGLFIVQGLSGEKRFSALAILGGVTYVLSAWSLFRDLGGIEWLTCLFLPSLFPIAVGLFYFLLPQLMVVRLIIVGIFIISMYALLLTANIFSVASIRTIQLLRAARAIGFLFTVVTATFLYHLLLSFKLHFWWNGLITAVISWLLFVQSLWSLELSDKGISRRVLAYSLGGSLVMLELAVVVSFLPVEVALGSLFLAMAVYVLLGLMYHSLEEKLFKKTMNEYIFFAFLGLIMIVVTSIVGWWS